MRYQIYELNKEALNEGLGNSVNVAIYDHNPIKNCQLHALDRLVSKELYGISLSSTYEKNLHQKLLWKATWNNKSELNRNTHFIQKEFCDYNLRMLQYKILSNILFINKLFFKFKNFHHHCVVFASLRMKRCCISYILVMLQSNYGLHHFVAQSLCISEITR